MKRELVKMEASFPTGLGVRKHGHLELVLKDAQYVVIFDGGISLTHPTHPGAYPANVLNDSATRAR